MDWERVIYPQMDPESGQIKPEPYLHGTFLLDGEVQFTHYLGPQELEEADLRVGMEVEMVLRPPEERKGMPTDISYFRIVEGPNV